MRNVIAIIFLFVANCALADEHWTEDVVVADGYTIKVNRSVEYDWGTGELATALRRYPTYYEGVRNFV